MTAVPDQLGIIAGRGSYPLELAESARQQGVKSLFALAFKKETDPAIERLVDKVKWVYLGQLNAALEAIRDSGVRQMVMAGQITPTHLFRIRMDTRLLALLGRLRSRNAHTIFGALSDELRSIGVELLPASRFMESAMPLPGQLSRRAPTEEELGDIELGIRVARVTSDLDVGQMVAVKKGTILAVEAFEGTDETLERAGRLGGEGAVVVKVAKRGHDMRFDIPVIGPQTMSVLKKIKASVLAVEAGRTIILERGTVVKQADRMNMVLLAVKIDRS